MKKPAWVTRWGLRLEKGSRAWRWATKVLGRKPVTPPAPAPEPKPSPQPLKGCDYVSGPSTLALNRAGIKFVFRYLSTPGNPKNLTAAEVKSLHAAGIKIGLVFETTGTTFVGGYMAGQKDAKAALAQAQALGVPKTVPIYMAIDSDPTGKEAKVVAYIKGAASVLGKARTGVYGGLTAVDACEKANVCDWFWQTLAWSGGNWHPASHVQQYANAQVIGGCQVDLDRAVRMPYGVW